MKYNFEMELQKKEMIADHDDHPTQYGVASSPEDQSADHCDTYEVGSGNENTVLQNSINQTLDAEIEDSTGNAVDLTANTSQVKLNSNEQIPLSYSTTQEDKFPVNGKHTDISHNDAIDCSSRTNAIVVAGKSSLNGDLNSLEDSRRQSEIPPVNDISQSKTTDNCHDEQSPDDSEAEFTCFSITLSDGFKININEETKSIPLFRDLNRAVNMFANKAKHDPEIIKLLKNELKGNNTDANYQKQISELKDTCRKLDSQNVELKHAIKQAEEKLVNHDAAAKRTIARLQNDSETKLRELNKQCAVADKEKQASVMNYARREKELLDLRRQKDGAENFAREAGKERDKAASQLKALRSDMIKLKSTYEKKETETNMQTKEFEKLKEEINSQSIKVRWTQNKLRSEVDSHKETKEKCEKMVLEIQHAKEETEQIRKNCQGMIKTYQESEEIKSNSLDIQLKEKVQALLEKEAEVDEVRSVHKQKNDELNALKIKHKDVFEENQVLNSKVESLDQERIRNEQTLRSYEEILNKQKATNAEMNDKVQYIFELEARIEEFQSTINELKDHVVDANEARDTSMNDLALRDQKQKELLEFTQKVSSRNTQLTVEAEELNSKLQSQSHELGQNLEQTKRLQDQVKELLAAKEIEGAATLKAQTALNTRLEEKEKTICQLLLQLEELKDDMRTLKRKNNAAVKDLSRQLSQVKKKAQNVDTLSASSIQHSAEGGSIGSRTSSITSLDKISSHSPENNHSTSNAAYDAIAVPETAVTGPDTLDRQLLIERIVRLQQIHAKKNEKIDFLSEHVNQLIGAVQKKQRIIQHYIMREEAGVLAPPSRATDTHKSKHGLTLDLSIEINCKMQSVLEDTILKNITLKENLETLGKEVQRLYQNNTTNSNP